MKYPGRQSAPIMLGLAALMILYACTNDGAGEPQPVNPNISSKEYTMSPTADDDRPTRSSSRIRAPEVAAVVHAGVRYEQLKAPSSEGLPPGGYVIATDVASGKRVWTAKVYETAIDPNRETDVQIVFFRSLALSTTGDSLLVEDEKGRKYSVSVRDGAVQPQP